MVSWPVTSRVPERSWSLAWYIWMQTPAFLHISTIVRFIKLPKQNRNPPPPRRNALIQHRHMMRTSYSLLRRTILSKMVNGFRYYRALESVSIASALSTALFTIYPCQIRVRQRWQSKLQLPTARKKEWRPATAGSLPHAVTCQHCNTHYFSRPRTRNPYRSCDVGRPPPKWPR